jgi:hypothetical protein
MFTTYLRNKFHMPSTNGSLVIAMKQAAKLCIFISYLFLLLCLCTLIVMYVLFCIFCFHHTSWHSSAPLTEVFPCFFPQL